ncbi:MutT NTP pyrophosphohydrolases including oxidative damage repair enzymes [Burkholderiaceae bacterium]|jgi:8-oxo-dGTP pyrophosphatase MutT (NUDIX family)
MDRMDINSIEVTAPPIPAATVVMLRDGAAGLEVFLLRRHSASAVLGGVFVFPGGKLDRLDADPGLHARLDHAPDVLHQRLRESDVSTDTAASLWVAALRESFEECGVLFAQGGAQGLHWDGLRHEEGAFADLIHRHDLQLQCEALWPWSRWITPRVPSVTNKRFDTRFFVARAPAGQQAGHDNVEATESVWMTPRDALHRYWAGQMEMAPPQIMSLVHLARFEHVDAVLHDAAQRGPHLVEPQPFDDNGTRVICYPGDPRHSVGTQAMPGPTRLRFVNQRFEPDGGLAAFGV